MRVFEYVQEMEDESDDSVIVSKQTGKTTHYFPYNYKDFIDYTDKDQIERHYLGVWKIKSLKK